MQIIEQAGPLFPGTVLKCTVSLPGTVLKCTASLPGTVLKRTRIRTGHGPDARRHGLGAGLRPGGCHRLGPGKD